MTIAGLYLSPEGIVLGADSTSSVPTGAPGSLHFFNFTQKVFEIGEEGTLGLLTWGLGGLGDMSYRTLLALLADDLAAKPATSVIEVASRWADHFWAAYENCELVKRFKELDAKGPGATGSPGRSQDEEAEYQSIDNALAVGFCVAGYVLPSRKPEAATLTVHLRTGKPKPQMAGQHSLSWWGVPNFLNRLLFGIDPELLQAILNTGKFADPAELRAIVQQFQIGPGVLPIRDAIDYVYSCIHCTIKAMKFSPLPQMCGGPIEIAVITTDRKFRWVRHKKWDSAITDGEIS